MAIIQPFDTLMLFMQYFRPKGVSSILAFVNCTLQGHQGAYNLTSVAIKVRNEIIDNVK